MMMHNLFIYSYYIDLEQLFGDLALGDRVIVSSNINGARIGTLRYVGETKFQPGTWVGVELDEPAGKNDGSVAGIRYRNNTDFIIFWILCLNSRF
jgi:dynactin complex subunit